VAFDVLFVGKRVGVIFSLEESALPLSSFAVVHNEFQMWEFFVIVSAHPDLAYPHAGHHCRFIAVFKPFFAIFGKQP
jgi:hypothetical protein